MGLSSWNQYGTTSTISATDAYGSVSGTYALLSEETNNTAAAIWPDSETASPSGGEVHSSFKEGTNSGYPTAAFRFQDYNNWYWLQLRPNVDMKLAKQVTGSQTNVDTASVSMPNYDYTTWSRFKFVAWKDGTGDYRAQVHYDDGSGYTQLGNDLVDSSPDHSAGGGIGIAGCFGAVADQTELYY